MTWASQVALGMRGLPEAASPLLMFLFLMLRPHTISTAHSDKCPCVTSVQHNDVVLLEEQLSDTTTRARKLNCCARRLLAAHDPHYHHNVSFSILWSFNGKENKMNSRIRDKLFGSVSTFRKGHCGLQTIQSDSLRFFDEGVYSCLVNSSSGASVNKTFSLCLNMNEDIGSPPVNPGTMKDTLALLRHTVTFICSAYVGEPRCGRMKDYHLLWTKERSDGSWVEASKLSHIEIITSGVENGVMKSRMTVHSVETQHFGRYRCTVTNHNGSLTLNVTLRKGVSSVQRETGEYRAALVILVAGTVFLGAAVFFWRRCHVAFSLHFRQRKASLSAGTVEITEPTPGACQGDVMSQPLLSL